MDTRVDLLPEELAMMCLKAMVVAAGGQVRIERLDLVRLADLEFAADEGAIIVTAVEQETPDVPEITTRRIDG